jgi:hypothetical protein
MSEEYEMTTGPPWHSSRAAVHHDNSRCVEGYIIKFSVLRSGNGGRPLCAECESLGETTGAGRPPSLGAESRPGPVSACGPSPLFKRIAQPLQGRIERGTQRRPLRAAPGTQR